jgi:hypothetical protein
MKGRRKHDDDMTGRQRSQRVGILSGDRYAYGMWCRTTSKQEERTKDRCDMSKFTVTVALNSGSRVIYENY